MFLEQDTVFIIFLLTISFAIDRNVPRDGLVMPVKCPGWSVAMLIVSMEEHVLNH